MAKSPFRLKGLSGQLATLAIGPIIFIVIMSILGWQGIKFQNENLHYIANERMTIVSILSDLRNNLAGVSRYTWYALGNQENKEERLNGLKKAREFFNNFNDAVVKFDKYNMSEKNKETMKNIKVSWEKIDKATATVWGQIEQEKYEDARKFLLFEFSPNTSPIMNSLEDMYKVTMDLNAQIVSTAVSESEKSKLFVLLAGILGTLFSIILSVIISTKLLGTLTNMSEQIADSGKQVSHASGYLSTVSHQVSSGTTQAAAALQETVASVEELSSMVKLNAENAKQAAQLSQTSYSTAEVGEVEIQKLLKSMTDISESSKKIEEITSVIDSIAFQTNLLALNAAVEAARAGEQGRGFAVVAEAVRNLAQRSASAAKDISNLIKDSVDKIKKGEAIADSSGQVLHSILISIKKVSELNTQISSASHEQANGILQISKAMNEIDSSTQQNAAGSEKVASISAELTNQAQSLQSLVAQLNNIIHGFSLEHRDDSDPNKKFTGEQMTLS